MSPLITEWVSGGNPVKIETAPLPEETQIAFERRHADAVAFWMGILVEDE